MGPGKFLAWSPFGLPKVRAVVLDNLCKIAQGQIKLWVSTRLGNQRCTRESEWTWRKSTFDPRRILGSSVRRSRAISTAATTRVVTSHKLISDLPIRGCRVPGCTSYNCAVQGRPHCCKQHLKMRAWAAQQPATHERSVVLDNLCRDKRAFGSPPDWAIDDALERDAGHGGKARAILQLGFNAEMFNAANAEPELGRGVSRVRRHVNH